MIISSHVSFRASCFVIISLCPVLCFFFFFFFNDTATTEIYTLSLHDALPIFTSPPTAAPRVSIADQVTEDIALAATDRKSTRLNSSHGYISYAVFCLKKKKKKKRHLAHQHKRLVSQQTLCHLTVYYRHPRVLL